jgi:uncharacterized repeat protein (TIGR01451 family)
MNRNLAMAFVLLVLPAYPARSGAVEVSAGTTYPVGSNPSAAVVADFNSDGKMDIAVANRDGNNVSILLGIGDGKFQSAMNFDAGNSPSAVALGDFDGDGKIDLAVFQPADLDKGLVGSANILLGNGNGTFQAPKTLPLTEPSFEMVVADFNSDRKSDIAFSNLDPTTNNLTMSIFLGKIDGTFQAAKNSSVPTGFNGSFGVADFNGDAKPDLAIGVAGGIAVLFGNGDGTFRQGSTATTADTFNVGSIQVADLNSDGKLDLLVWSTASFHSLDKEGPSSSTTRVSFFKGNGNGTFQPEQVVTTATVDKINVFAPPTGSSVSQAFLGDFNGDGKPDVAFRRTSYFAFQVVSTLAIALGKGDGNFSSTLSLPSDTGPVLAVNDLNSDKLCDFVVLPPAPNYVAVLLNSSPTSGADLGITQSDKSPEPIAVGDHLTYSALVLNEGPQNATGVTFTDTLPISSNFVSATATQGNCTQTHLVVTCNLGSLVDVADVQITIVVVPTVTGTITNSMNVSANESDAALANNLAAQITTVVSAFTLTVAKAGNGSGTIHSGSGIDCGATCAATFSSGTTVSLIATPSETSVFAGWSGACTGTDPNACSLIVNSNESVTATFDPGPDFSLSAAVANLNLKRGGEASEVLTIAAQGGFSGTIGLACSSSGPSPSPVCSISPSSVTPGNSATLTVNAATMVATSPPKSSSRVAGLYSSFVAVGVLGCVLMSSLDRKRRAFWAVCLLLMVTVFSTACGGGVSNPPISPANYTVTVTATSGAIHHSAQVIVTLN